MAFSPTGFSLVQMYEDGQIKWHSLDYTLGDPATVSNGSYCFFTKVSIYSAT
jgi:mediator of RNA polymerase II transcription subunit 16, fungi type